MRMFRVLFLSLLAAVPSSTNYTLKAYDFGNGSGSGSSTNYTLQGQAGGTGGRMSSTNYVLPAGIHASRTVAVPPAPTFVNDTSSYSKLHLTLNATGLPSDAKYLIAISSDNFTTTQYVQLDNTVGSSVSASNYQTYAAWGGASGFYVLGLSQSTLYSVEVAALQGNSTGSAFGPTASATTLAPSVTFGLSTSLTSTPPFTITFSSLGAGSVVSGDATVTSTLTTNAVNGGSILVSDQNAGLKSTSRNLTLASATADLSSTSSGYGARVTSATQTSGGPLTASSPFNGASNNVGGLTASWQTVGSFAAPVTGGSLTTSLLAKAAATTPAAPDYTDVITISLSLLF
jgi:hypothetical protein